MEKKKRERLEKAGWKVGSTKEFLGLSDEEARYIELKLALSEGVRVQRSHAGLSQEELARRVGSSQSRISKMEKADPTVSLDLLVRSMFAAGATRHDVAATITSKSAKSSSSSRGKFESRKGKVGKSKRGIAASPRRGLPHAPRS